MDAADAECLLDRRFELLVFFLFGVDLIIDLAVVGIRRDQPGDQPDYETAAGAVGAGDRTAHEDPFHRFAPGVLPALGTAHLRRLRSRGNRTRIRIGSLR